MEIPPEEDLYPELSWLNKDLTQLSQSFSKCNIFGTKFDDSDSEDEEIDYYKTFMRDFIKVSSVYSSHLMEEEQKTEWFMKNIDDSILQDITILHIKS